MAVKTSNKYGNISISDEAIAIVAGSAALDCYGVINLVSKKLSDNFSELFKTKPLSSGVKVLTVDNRVQIDIFVVLKYGVSLNAVCESLKSAVKYSVESFTGMIVDSVNVNVMGVRV